MNDTTRGGIDWRPNQIHWGAVHKSIHWLMALIMIGMVGLGWYMTNLRDPETGALTREAYSLIQLHKSFGFTVLGLLALRVLWRGTSGTTPPLPEATPAWQRLGAHLGHLGLYGVMIGLPLTGWLMVSSSETGIPTKYFGLFEIPHIAPRNGDFSELMEEVHELLVWAFIVLLAVHILAALKHHFVNRDSVLRRMFPGRP